MIVKNTGNTTVRSPFVFHVFLCVYTIGVRQWIKLTVNEITVFNKLSLYKQMYTFTKLLKSDNKDAVFRPICLFLVSYNTGFTLLIFCVSLGENQSILKTCGAPKPCNDLIFFALMQPETVYIMTCLVLTQFISDWIKAIKPWNWYHG